jgi:hypothetical protein
VRSRVSLLSFNHPRLPNVTAGVALALTGLGALACGEAPPGVAVPTLARDEAIVGGAVFSGLPAIGALVDEDGIFCSGTLIAPRTVLTAGHCLDGITADDVGFAIGTDAASPTHLLRARRLERHPRFDRRTLANDIGRVLLERDAPVAPLPVLGHLDADWVDAELFFVGYGVTNGTSGRGAGRKRGVWMPITEVAATTFSYASPGKATCYGDSGGPALHRDAVGAYFVAGVTSWGDARCVRFGVDTRVDAFLDFLGIAAADLDPCHGETWEGRCEENVVIWCDQDEVVSMDCADYAATCAWDEEDGFYNCSGAP